ncbi:hypothetical protein Bca4012_037809 [Brassica carinata]
MLPSHMAHHLTFHISMLLNWRKADRKVSEVMVFRDSTISKEISLILKQSYISPKTCRVEEISWTSK